MPLPTQGFDAHGHKMALSPEVLKIPAIEMVYVPQYRGYSYNTYNVQYLGEFWPPAETVARAIEHVTPISAHWSSNVGPDGVRHLTVYTD